MQAPRMGGKPLLRVFLKADDAVTDSLLPRREEGGRLEHGVRDVLKERYQSAFDFELLQEPCGRTDLFLQQLSQVAVPESLRQEARAHGLNFLAEESRTQALAEQPDVLLLSLQPEVEHSLWQHRQSGYLVDLPAQWEDRCTAAQREWILQAFSSTGLLSVDQFRANMLQIIQAVKEQMNAHLLVYNCSSVDPEDQVHNYHGVEDTMPVRVHRFNLALMQLSMLEGVSIIDVERLVAQLGGEQHVKARFCYSNEALTSMAYELLRVLDDIGFFENRPLVMQVGQRR